jgi:hypothetical protein
LHSWHQSWHQEEDEAVLEERPVLEDEAVLEERPVLEDEAVHEVLLAAVKPNEEHKLLLTKEKVS